MDTNKLNGLLAIAIESSLKAGEEILNVYGTDDFQVETKSDDSPLTIADQKSNALIMDGLIPTKIPVLSEEGKQLEYADRKGWDYFWLVDPLDGTKEFIKRNGEFTVNIALVNGAEPVMGVIYVPVTKELYFGIKGEGAYKVDGITEFDASGLAAAVEALVAGASKLPIATDKTAYTAVGSRSHMSPETEAYVAKLKETYGEVEMISKGSSLKICMVAEGKADVYPRFGPTMEWDTGAGHAIAVASGASLVRHDGEPMVYNKENLLNPWFIVERKK